MSARSTKSSIGQFFMTLGNAIAVASAVSHGRQPIARNLRGLGIDPVAFSKIRRF